MKKKEIFFVKIGDECVIKHGDQSSSVMMKDFDGERTIVQGEIGCFWNFETQLKEELPRIGYKEGFLRKNIVYVGLNLSGTANTRKNIMSSFDQMGFDEVYLIHEHIAIKQALTSEINDTSKSLNIYFGNERIEVCLVAADKIINDSVLTISKQVFDSFIFNPETKTFLVGLIMEEISQVLKSNRFDLNNSINIFGERIQQIPFKAEIKKYLGLNCTEIVDYQEKIIFGMEKIAQTTPSDLNEILGKR